MTLYVYTSPNAPIGFDENFQKIMSKIMSKDDAALKICTGNANSR